MKKVLVCFLLLAAFAPLASAGDLDVWFDLRGSAFSAGPLTCANVTTPAHPFINSASGVGGASVVIENATAGAQGDADIVFVSPKLNAVNGPEYSGEHNPGGINDSSLTDIHLYAENSMGATEVLSSLGLTFTLTGHGGDYTAALAGFTFTTTGFDAPTGGTAVSVVSGTEISTKAVKVPVAGAPAMYDSSLGINGTTGCEEIGYLTVEGDERLAFNGFIPGSTGTVGTYEIRAKNNSLLTTRVDNPPAVAADLSISFGYVLGVPDPATVLGTDTIPVRLIGGVIVKQKGDYDENGQVQFPDVIPFSTSVSALINTLNQNDVWSGDFDGNWQVQFPDVLPFVDNLNLP